MVASITELNLKNFWSYFVFIPHAVKSKIQASKSKGIVSISIRSEGLFTQRTLTVWETEQAMREYVRSGDHLKAMRAFAKHANKSYSAHFEVDAAPSWEMAIDYLRAHGKEHYGQRK
jgi:hypothetical protein